MVTPQEDPHIESAEVEMPCADLAKTLDFFTQTLRFRLVAIFPADDPSIAVISGYGISLRLQRDAAGTPAGVRLLCADPQALGNGERELIAPNGARITLAKANPPITLPPNKPSFVISRAGGDGDWHTGRAGMQYRDLLPDRNGGRFIASHIRIPDGGPVPDYVHYHNIRFQMIYCRKGWVRLVYEDQGPPFVMQEGDCVLQPPLIRHRVLECSPGFEVIEIASPAEHETRHDADLDLPTTAVHANRDYRGQRFVFHKAAEVRWIPWRGEGFESRDIGIGAATNGLAAVRVVRPAKREATALFTPGGEFNMLFVLAGSMHLTCDGHGTHELRAGDSLVIPAGIRVSLADCARDLEWLEVEAG